MRGRSLTVNARRQRPEDDSPSGRPRIKNLTDRGIPLRSVCSVDGKHLIRRKRGRTHDPAELLQQGFPRGRLDGLRKPGGRFRAPPGDRAPPGARAPAVSTGLLAVLRLAGVELAPGGPAQVVKGDRDDVLAHHPHRTRAGCGGRIDQPRLRIERNVHRVGRASGPLYQCGDAAFAFPDAGHRALLRIRSAARDGQLVEILEKALVHGAHFVRTVSTDGLLVTACGAADAD